MTQMPHKTGAMRPARGHGWLCLIAAMAWVALVRVPLILNAETHLDSDLAVDGLTLLDATRGAWRWHFPGTPYMGILPILVAMPGTWLLGVSASSLVTGGVVAYEAAILAIFWLNWRAFGPRVAAWGLVPLAFASVGTVWLSGRLTGGHLLTLAWHATALTLLIGVVRRGSAAGVIGLGAWCGLGLYVDQMFLMTALVAMPIALAATLRAPGWGRKIGLAAALAGSFAVGVSPREIGRAADPHDAYGDQFATIFRPETGGPHAGSIDWDRARTLLAIHARLLALECLPRLVSGHRLSSPSLPTEPRPETLAGRTRAVAATPSILAHATVALTIGLFVASLVALAARRDLASAAILLPAALVTAGFLVSANIFNSDNYRYLVYWLVPGSSGFGVLMEGLWRRGGGGRAVAIASSVGLAALVSADSARWYRGFGWVDDGLRPIHRPIDDPALDALNSMPHITAIFGGYWDVYRLSFLTGGRVRGVPFPNYPDRFDASGDFPGRRPTILVARRGELGDFYLRQARSEGAGVRIETPGATILEWPLKP